MLTTTLKQLKEFSPCESGLTTLINSLPANQSEDEPITLLHILESNGLEDAIWALRTQPLEYSVKFAIGCAEHVLPIFESEFPDDARPRKAIEAAKTALGNPTVENRNAARAAARAAYTYVAAAADAAVNAAAYAAAYAAARAAAYAAADAAAAAAARAAAADAYAVAARAAEKEYQTQLFKNLVDS